MIDGTNFQKSEKSGKLDKIEQKIWKVVEVRRVREVALEGWKEEKIRLIIFS